MAAAPQVILSETVSRLPFGTLGRLIDPARVQRSGVIRVEGGAQYRVASTLAADEPPRLSTRT